MTRKLGLILMVGSIPLPMPEEVFRTRGKYIGSYVSCLPDGEAYPRSLWVDYLGPNTH